LLAGDAEPEAAAAHARLARWRAAAQRLDAYPRLLTAARRLRRRLPGDEHFGDPLSTAGRTPAQLVARSVSAFGPERESLMQELGLTGLQLWQSLSEATGRGRGDRELAVMFTDLVNFSAWALKAGDEAVLELLRQVSVAVEGVVEERGGRIVKRLGDGLMATFADAGAAVEAALDAHAAVAEIDVDGYRPRMRAGVHWGRPRLLGGDYLGVDVNVAARVAAAAKADQVLATEALLDRVDHDRLKLSRRRRLRAQGAPRDVHVLQVERA
jgi:adenylate cyclase